MNTTTLNIRIAPFKSKIGECPTPLKNYSRWSRSNDTACFTGPTRHIVAIHGASHQPLCPSLSR